MGGGVANNLNRRFVAIGEDTQLCIVLDNMGRIDFAPVNDTRQSRLGKPRPNIGGDIKHGDRGLERSLGAIGQGNNRHERSSIQWRPLPEAACEGREFVRRHEKIKGANLLSKKSSRASASSARTSDDAPI